MARRLEPWRHTPRLRPSFETLAISAFTRVCDALWLAPQDEGRRYITAPICHGTNSASP